MSYHDNDQLLADLRKRDPAAFRWLFEAYADKIYRLALSLLENETEADGVVQDTFVKLIEHLDRFEGRSKIGTWLYRVAHNLCYDRLRVRQRDAHWLASNQPDNGDGESVIPAIFIDWTNTPDLLVDEQEIQAILVDLIHSLPLKLRAVLLLRDVEGVSTAECAAALNISESSAKVRLHRARLQLREKLSLIMADTLKPEGKTR